MSDDYNQILKFIDMYEYPSFKGYVNVGSEDELMLSCSKIESHEFLYMCFIVPKYLNDEFTNILSNADIAGLGIILDQITSHSMQHILRINIMDIVLCNINPTEENAIILDIILREGLFTTLKSEFQASSYPTVGVDDEGFVPQKKELYLFTYLYEHHFLKKGPYTKIRNIEFDIDILDGKDFITKMAIMFPFAKINVNPIFYEISDNEMTNLIRTYSNIKNNKYLIKQATDDMNLYIELYENTVYGIDNIPDVFRKRNIVDGDGLAIKVPYDILGIASLHKD